MNNFLPENYKVPKSGGNYFKPQDGQNKVRILSAPIMGWEYWNTDNKPVRRREILTSVPADARLIDGGFQQKHFWALVVWNYAESAIQIWEITQSTIQGQLQDLINSEDWGDPRGYDITVHRKGQKLDTEYSVMPSVPKKVSGEIMKAYEEKSINLQELFSGGNPMKEEAEDNGTDESFEEMGGEDVEFPEPPASVRR